MKPLLAILFCLLSTYSNAQTVSDLRINHVRTLKQTPDVGETDQIGQHSSYAVIGSTEKSVILKEVIHITRQTGKIYDYDYQVRIHFLDPITFQTKYTEAIWTQTKQSQMTGPYGNSFDLELLDQVPNIFVFSNNVYAVSKTFGFEHAQMSERVAAKGTVLKEMADHILSKTAYIHSRDAPGTPVELKIAHDSSFLYIVSGGMLKEKDQYPFRYGLRIINENLRQVDYLALKVITHLQVFEEHVLYWTWGGRRKIKNGDKITYPVLNIVNMMYEETTKLPLLNLHYDVKRITSELNVLTKWDDTGLHLLIGATCTYCPDPNQTLTFWEITVDLNDQEPLVADIKKISLERILESEESDQDQIQTDYFNALAQVKLGRELKPKGLKTFQKKGNVTTGNLLVYRTRSKVDYIYNAPLLIAFDYYDQAKVVALNRMLNTNALDTNRPLLVDYNGDQMYFLANFTMPNKYRNKTQMLYESPQILQLVTVELDELSVIRENIEGSVDSPEKNDYYFIDPSTAVVLKNAVLCIVRSPENEYKLAHITW